MLVKKNNTNENGVLKAFRIGGWFAYKPTPNGLVRASGEQLRQYQLGSSRLSQKLIDQRFDWVDKNGLPKAPDWNELRDIRHRQNLVAASQATSSREIRDATDAIQETYSQMDDFLDYFDGRRGQIPFEDQDGSSEAMEPLSLSWISPQDLCEDANFLSLHPRVRNEIVMQMGLNEISEKESSRTRDSVIVDKIKQDTSHTSSTIKINYAQTICKLGIDKARSMFKPKSGKNREEKEELAKIAKQKLATQRIKVKANVAMLKSKGIFGRKKKRLSGPEREKQANATKAYLTKLAAHVAAELASLSEEV